MISIEGSSELGHPAKDVFTFGLDSALWEQTAKGISIQPEDERIALGGIIGVAVNLLGRDISYDAEVTECVRNKHLAIKGTPDGYGDTALTFDLEENKKRTLTVVRFGFTANFNQLGLLKKKGFETAVSPILNTRVNGFALQLARRIDKTITDQQSNATRSKIAA
jgi:hypothetical protein